MLFYEHSSSENWDRSTALYRTDDSGGSWREIDISSTPIADLDMHGMRVRDLAVYDGQTALLAVRSGSAPAVVLETSDGGSTWQPQILPLPQWRREPYSVCETASPDMFSVQSAVVFAQCDGEPILYRTDSAGDQWDAYPFPETYRIAMAWDSDHPIVFLDSEIGWALGSTIYKTVDGGRTWNDVKVVGWDSGDFSIAGEQLAWVVANESVPYSHNAGAFVLLRSEDGMRTWQELTARIVP
jgi:photosystem II stability/assembly factor-like uncharacterized protein